MLSKRFQISDSLAEECEAVGEARPPRRVAEISDFQWCSDGISADAMLEQRDRRSRVYGLRVIVPWWRSSASLPGGGGVVLRCVRLFVRCWFTLRRVMYE